LNERNIQPLSDDYIKFIRLGQHFVEKNGEGILAYISNNSFIDGLIHRQMRKNLLDTFDKIYILNLHGNAKKKETAIDGCEDKNVFDIQQGVSINIFVKKHNKGACPLATIYHCDLFGKRQEKYNFLLENDLHSVKWTELQPVEPDYFFVPKDFSLKEEYEKGFKIDELFIVNTSGVITHNDEELIDFNPFNTGFNQKISYRPFDIRYINYDLKKVGRHRYNIMKHLLKENVALIVSRQTTQDFRHCFVTNKLADGNITASARSFGAGFVFPLSLYHENFGKTEKVTNMNEAIVKELAAKIGVEKVNEIQIFDYIYAVLHSPAYRERYIEFLKIDFPRISYPENAEQFKCLAGFGEQLRKLHLMENVEPQKDVANFPVSGTNEIEKPKYNDNKVFINDAQYFDNVPSEAWNFHIGGYQPAQKWLKDRKGRKLGFDDVQLYQRIITVLVETERIMRKIDVNL
jgi:predicted helicase